jgi:hypothetical protein
MSARPFTMTLLGALAGGAVSFCVGGILLFSHFSLVSARARGEFAPIPVLVAAVDISPGAQVNMDMLSQRSVPEQAVTHSLIKSEEASFVVGQKSTARLSPGDVLRWSDFGGGVLPSCVAEADAVASSLAVVDPEVSQLLGAMRRKAGLKAPSSPPERR